MPAVTPGEDRRVMIVASVFALLPTLAVLAGFFIIPSSLSQLVQVLSLSGGGAVLTAIILWGERILRAKRTTVAAWSIGAVAAGIIAATGYTSFANQHIVGVAEGEVAQYYILPLRPSAEAQEIVGAYNGDYAQALQASSQGVRLRQLLEDESGGAAAIMMILLLAAQMLVAAGAAAGALRLTGDPTTDPNG